MHQSAGFSPHAALHMSSYDIMLAAKSRAQASRCPPTICQYYSPALIRSTLRQPRGNNLPR